MILRNVMILVLAICAAMVRSAAADSDGLRATVDARVEFLAAAARTAGFDEYRMQNAASPYSARVDEAFAKHREHPAFEAMRRMRKEHGLSYDAVMSLAVHLTDPPGLGELVPFEPRPPQLDRRLVAGPTRELLRQLRDLAKAVDWSAFMERERAFHALAAERLTEVSKRWPLVAWFDRNLGVRQGAEYMPIAGLLCGGHNYGVSTEFPDGRPARITPVIGCWTWDSIGNPVFGGSRPEQVGALIAHELCHAYTNAVVDRHVAELQPVGERLFALSRSQMEKQAYGTWKTTMGETFVRAFTILCAAETISPELAEQLARSDASRGFRWVPALAKALKPALASRKPDAGIESMLPLITETLETEATRLEAERGVTKP